FLLLHNVLYYGNSPFVLRFLSGLFVTGSAALVSFILLREGFKKSAAILAGACFLFQPTVVETGVFVRMYGLFLFEATLLLFILQSLFQKPGDRRLIAGGGIVLALALYTSYFALLLTASLGLAGLLLLPKKQTQAFGLAIISICLCAGLLAIPWMLVLPRFVHQESGAVNAANRLNEVFTLLSILGGSGIATLVLLAGLATAIWNPDSRKAAIFLSCFWVAIPVAILSIASPTNRPVVERYVCYTWPALFIAGVLGIRVILSKYKTALGIFLGILLIWNFGMTNLRVFVRYPDWWEAASIIEHNAKPRETIMTGGFLSGEGMVYHLKNPRDFTFLHYVTTLDGFYVAARDPEVVWYVNSAPLPKSYSDIMRRYFPYRVSFIGNGTMNLITVASKKNFTMSDGSPATYFEPVPLEYEK
ncbi:MAG: phospholipid carrier-dependent glycosyltransferase, partial [Candidatus Sumerlaeota bacterium]